MKPLAAAGYLVKEELAEVNKQIQKVSNAHTWVWHRDLQRVCRLPLRDDKCTVCIYPHRLDWYSAAPCGEFSEGTKFVHL